MYNCPPKIKARKPITDENKIKQIKSWNESEISKQIPNLRAKKVHFDSTTRFLDACINFYKDEINDLLDNGVDINCSDKDHLTAIHQACINSRIDLVDYLLTKNANINVCDKEGWTPLHIAADIGSYELAKYLIDHGARLDAANYDGVLPIMFVNEHDYPDLKVYFQKEMDKRRINSEECSNYEREIMMEDVKRWKINNKYNPPIDKINKSTPVHVAASKNYVNVLSELLPLLSREELDAQDVDGWTALHAAAHWGHREACLILISHGANLDIRTRANETIMDIIDPDLKIILSEEIKKVQIEKAKMRTDEIVNEIQTRPDNVNRRRSSIGRQSVEWKKKFQMKDPASERETLVKAGLNSDSAGILTIEECDEKMISPDKNIKLELNDDNLSTSISEFNDFKTSSIDDYEIDGDKSDINLNRIKNNTNYSQDNLQSKIPIDHSSQIIQLSNGNNSKNNITDSNNGALMNEVGSDINSDSEIFKSHETEIRLRPKSTRDAIISHRSTLGRTSLVMAPSKSDEAEVMRREKARRVRSIRRSTQAIDLGGYKEVEKKFQPIDKDTKTDSSENVVKTSSSCAEIKKSKNNDKLDVLKENFLLENRVDDLSKIEIRSCNNINKEETKFDFLTNKSIEKNKTNLIDKSDGDHVDSNISSRRIPLKYQVSCPISQQTQSITHDRARFQISNKIKGFIKKVSTDTQKPALTISNPIITPGGRGLNVNQCIEAGDFDKNTDAFSKNDSTKYSGVKHIPNSDYLMDRDSGSFVARPVFGNSNDTKKSEYHDSKHPLSVSVDKEDKDETSSTSETSDNNCLKDENQISKSILTKMLSDQTTKQELLKEISLLNEEIKELKEKNIQLESSTSIITDKKKDQNENDDKVSKFETEVYKLRDENKKLKSQNEALLRVISRIQQELESFRKVPLI